MHPLHEIDGLIVLDKPPGMSSADVVAIVKRETGAKKAGHTGTLDPFATGVLICCLNSGTKLARFFLKGNKKYRGVMRLGIETDTQDVTGRIVATHRVGKLRESNIQEAFDRFSGNFEQTPPVYSALKHNGVPLYKLVRKGTPVQKSPRRVEVYALDIMKIDNPEILFEVSCSAGTYIRTLCADIGNILGCGGHLKALRRIESGGFSLDDAIDLNELKELVRVERISNHVIDPSQALPHMDQHIADKALTEKIKYGRIINCGDVPPPGNGSRRQYVKIVDSCGRLLTILYTDSPRGDKYKYACVFPKAMARCDVEDAVWKQMVHRKTILH